MIENFTEEGTVALATVQSKLEAVAKGRRVANKRGGTMYKYANIADVIAAVREPLTENGWFFTHTTVACDAPDVVRMVCILQHVSGMSVTSEATSYVPRPDPQTLGSALTYLRRYTLLGALGLETEDDDALSHRRPRDEDRRGVQAQPQHHAPTNEPPPPQPREPQYRSNAPTPAAPAEDRAARQRVNMRIVTRLRQFEMPDAEMGEALTTLLAGVGPRECDIGILEALAEELESVDVRGFDKMLRDAQPGEE